MRIKEKDVFDYKEPVLYAAMAMDDRDDLSLLVAVTHSVISSWQELMIATKVAADTLGGRDLVRPELSVRCTDLSTYMMTEIPLSYSRVLHTDPRMDINLNDAYLQSMEDYTYLHLNSELTAPTLQTYRDGHSDADSVLVRRLSSVTLTSQSGQSGIMLGMGIVSTANGYPEKHRTMCMSKNELDYLYQRIPSASEPDIIHKPSIPMVII